MEMEVFLGKSSALGQEIILLISCVMTDRNCLFAIIIDGALPSSKED